MTPVTTMTVMPQPIAGRHHGRPSQPHPLLLPMLLLPMLLTQSPTQSRTRALVAVLVVGPHSNRLHHCDRHCGGGYYVDWCWCLIVRWEEDRILQYCIVCMLRPVTRQQ
jgi:hypothetical protein